MVGEERGAWEERERRVWEWPHPRKEARNLRKGKGAFPHGFHMVSTWLSRISINRDLTQAERGSFFPQRGIPPRNLLPFPSESAPSEQKFPRGPSLEKDISLLQENLCDIQSTSVLSREYLAVYLSACVRSLFILILLSHVETMWKPCGKTPLPFLRFLASFLGRGHSHNLLSLSSHAPLSSPTISSACSWVRILGLDVTEGVIPQDFP